MKKQMQFKTQFDELLELLQANGITVIATGDKIDYIEFDDKIITQDDIEKLTSKKLKELYKWEK